MIGLIIIAIKTLIKLEKKSRLAKSGNIVPKAK
jgi:hypothetical protein